MNIDDLKYDVWQANIALVEAGLVILTWGNVSGIDRDQGIMVIKPSGVAYDTLTAGDIVLVNIEDGKVVDSPYRPSSDTPTHLHLYRNFPAIGGVAHTHSTFATSWAQAQREIPCLGTTHADHYAGPVPMTRQLTAEEVAEDYEGNTGAIIVERFKDGDLDPMSVPAVLLPGHGPFTWDTDAHSAVKQSVALEQIACMAHHTFQINDSATPLASALRDKHFARKHGPNAYYGQEGK